MWLVNGMIHEALASSRGGGAGHNALCTAIVTMAAAIVIIANVVMAAAIVTIVNAVMAAVVEPQQSWS